MESRHKAGDVMERCELKTCTKCRADLLRTEFHRNSTSKDLLFHTCKPCCRERRKNYYLANKERPGILRR